MQARVLVSRSERRALGPSVRGARHSGSRRWLDFVKGQMIKYCWTTLANQQMTRAPSIYESNSAQARCGLKQRDLFLRLDKNLKV